MSFRPKGEMTGHSEVFIKEGVVILSVIKWSEESHIKIKSLFLIYRTIVFFKNYCFFKIEFTYLYCISKL